MQVAATGGPRRSVSGLEFAVSPSAIVCHPRTGIPLDRPASAVGSPPALMGSRIRLVLHATPSTSVPG
jgi:hypothetical protein